MMATASETNGGRSQQAQAESTPLANLLDRPVKYRPVGSAEEITLTPRQVLEYLCVRTRQGHAAGKADVIKFMQLCKARGLDPWVGDAYLVGYDSQDGPVFSLITSIQALLKRAEANPEFDGLESGVIVQSDAGITERPGELVLMGETLVGAWARVHRKDRKIPTYKAINRGAYDKGRSLWKSDAPGMLAKCAKAGALRDAFPNSVGGLYVHGEISEDTPHSAPVHADQSDAASQSKSASLANTLAGKRAVGEQDDPRGNEQPPATDGAAADPDPFAPDIDQALADATTIEECSAVYEKYKGEYDDARWLFERVEARCAEISKSKRAKGQKDLLEKGAPAPA